LACDRKRLDDSRLNEDQPGRSCLLGCQKANERLVEVFGRIHVGQVGGAGQLGKARVKNSIG
jgi:hypothetical protein